MYLPNFVGPILDQNGLNLYYLHNSNNNNNNNKNNNNNNNTIIHLYSAINTSYS